MGICKSALQFLKTNTLVAGSSVQPAMHKLARQCYQQIKSIGQATEPDPCKPEYLFAGPAVERPSLAWRTLYRFSLIGWWLWFSRFTLITYTNHPLHPAPGDAKQRWGWAGWANGENDQRSALPHISLRLMGYYLGGYVFDLLGFPSALRIGKGEQM